jgi:Tfp pilus assembly protein PilF
MTFAEGLIRKPLLLFLLVSLILYGNTLWNGYGLDDEFVTENNITNEGIKSFKKIFTSYYADDGKSAYEYRPFVKVSFALEHQLFGVRPWVSHLINLVLYALCLFLLHKVLLLVFHARPPLFSLCVALLFAFLPVHAEVVASLKNRDVLLCFICCMGIIIQLDAFFRTRHYLHLAWAVLFSLIGFLTKYDLLPYLVIAPLVLYKKYRAQVKIIPLLYAAGIIFTGFFLSKAVKLLLLNKSVGERIYSYSENPLLFDHSLALKFSTAFNTLGFYFKMLLFPSKMVCYYGYDTIPIHDFFSAYAIPGMLLLLTMIFYFFKLIKTENPVWYAIVFSGISISMYLNVVKPVTGIVAERFLFFASIGFCMFLVHLFFTYLNGKQDSLTLKSTKPGFKVALVLLFVTYSACTISRNSEWKNKITLYEHDIKKRPESVPLNLLYSMEILSNLNRPNYFMTDQNKMSYIDKANASLHNVLKKDPENLTALHNLGFIRQNVHKDYAGAIPYYERALKSDSSKFESQFNLAYCYYTIGRGEDAERLVLKIYPTHSDNQAVLDLMNYVLIENKKSHEGIILFDELAKKHPENNSIPIILGNFYLSISDTLNARKSYSKALENDPGNDQLFKIVAKLSKRQL